MKSFFWVGVVTSAFLISGCEKPNSKPTYGDSGLPKNCRAIIQTNIDAWRAKQYTSKEVIESIERNCGANGYSWEN